MGRALVIAGSDKRGTIYGIYEVSQQIGVSPWYWWADVPVERRESLALQAGRRVAEGPSVRYRGIFLNDEAPDLTNWVRAKYGNVTAAANPRVVANVANYGHEFYTKLFELMLRLRANYLWPAMWNNAFNEDDAENARLADEYGIVMGTSHQEPMLRAQKEWDWRFQKTIGTWNYAKHPDVLENFWREGVRRNKNFESIITMGLRGANDTEMAPGGPDANRKLLEQIVDRQRDILRAEVNPDLSQVPQVWCLYKEVQEFYEHGMRVPDDVTLLWAEDNWGNLRRLPTAAERRRSGGAGIYYHFDYHGGPRSYQWLNTSPLPKIWEQMSMAKTYGADRIWIVNVGHFKGYEVPMEFFISLGWDTDRWNGGNLEEFTRAWATREFGAGPAAGIADVMAQYAKYNGRRKPELLAPDTFSLTDYREAERIVADYWADAGDESRRDRAGPAAGDAGRLSPVHPFSHAGQRHRERDLPRGRPQRALRAARPRQRGGAGGGGAPAFRRVHRHHEPLQRRLRRREVGAFHGPAGARLHNVARPAGQQSAASEAGRAGHSCDAAALGVAVEGRAAAVEREAALPRFDSLHRQTSFIDVFNRGRGPLEFTTRASEPWIMLGLPKRAPEADVRVASVRSTGVACRPAKPPARSRSRVTAAR